MCSVRQRWWLTIIFSPGHLSSLRGCTYMQLPDAGCWVACRNLNRGAWRNLSMASACPVSRGELSGMEPPGFRTGHHNNCCPAGAICVESATRGFSCLDTRPFDEKWYLEITASNELYYVTALFSRSMFSLTGWHNSKYGVHVQGGVPLSDILTRFGGISPASTCLDADLSSTDMAELV